MPDISSSDETAAPRAAHRRLPEALAQRWGAKAGECPTDDVVTKAQVVGQRHLWRSFEDGAQKLRCGTEPHMMSIFCT